MRIEHFNSYKEAKERATALLLSDSKDYPTLTTTERKVDLPSPGSYIVSLTDGKSGNIAILKRTNYSKRIGEDWESPEAWKETEQAELFYISSSDEVIYPFRNLNLHSLVFVYMMRGTHNPFVKPSEPITPAQAQTIEGELRLRSYFGEEELNDMELQALLRIKAGEEDIWQDWVDTEGRVDHLLGVSVYRPLLSRVTEKEAKNVEDCIAAVAELSGRDLTEEEVAQVREGYDYYQRELFLYYCIYSFLLTEKYSDLKKALSDFKSFGLKKDWSKDFLLLEGDTPEEYIISHYYDSETFRLLSVTSLRELAKYTEIPLTLLLECSSEYSTKRMIRNRHRNK